MKKNYRNPMTRPENFMNPAGNVMKEIKEADLNNFSAGAGEPRVSDGSQFCTSTKECNWGTIMFVCKTGGYNHRKHFRCESHCNGNPK